MASQIFDSAEYAWGFIGVFVGFDRFRFRLGDEQISLSLVSYHFLFDKSIWSDDEIYKYNIFYIYKIIFNNNFILQGFHTDCFLFKKFIQIKKYIRFALELLETITYIKRSSFHELYMICA